jgi:hypothetical protein
MYQNWLPAHTPNWLHELFYYKTNPNRTLHPSPRRQVDLRPHEVLYKVVLPFTRPNEYVKEFKQAPRREDDIAIVNAGGWGWRKVARKRMRMPRGWSRPQGVGKYDRGTGSRDGHERFSAAKVTLASCYGITSFGSRLLSDSQQPRPLPRTLPLPRMLRNCMLRRSYSPTYGAVCAPRIAPFGPAH